MSETNTEYYIKGVLSGDRQVLAQTITLIESTLPSHQAMVRCIMDALLPFSGGSIRLGITGVPGVGKSTFIEKLGSYLIESGKKVAVLAVDPSSAASGGSILGDRTRMPTLSADPCAFVRPSPSGNTLGGVARKTKESILVCEAAGFDVVIVETVGVGQSETAVSDMVDFFLLLMLAGAGDELQGIKRGIVELADAIVITKADGENLERAKTAKKVYESALHLFYPTGSGWTPRVMICSAVTGEGINEVWETICEQRRYLEKIGKLKQKRREQDVKWFRFLVEEGLWDWFFSSVTMKKTYKKEEESVFNGEKTAMAAANKVLSQLYENSESNG